MPIVQALLDQSKRTLLPYQAAVIDAYANHHFGIIEAPTGRGKTMAMALGIIEQALATKVRPKVLWVTPMRALARDTAQQLTDIFGFFYDDIRVVLRTSDSNSYQKKKARSDAWDILITTPESCALFSTYADMVPVLKQVDVVVVDEWHVLVQQKRGILFELFLSWFADIQPTLKRWALSATLSNPSLAATVLAPGEDVAMVRDDFEKVITGDVLLPTDKTQGFRQLGKQLLPTIIEQIKAVQSTIMFTNTRSQSEQWYQLLKDSGEFETQDIAIHHSAVDRSVREAAEAGIKAGRVKCIVATSSLDLGVDLEPVDAVIHIGSPKGMARLKQRAGRSGHSPFDASHVMMVPRHGFEVIEAVAAVEQLMVPVADDVVTHGRPMDILMQHVVNICMGRSYDCDALLAMCHATHTYADLPREELEWVLNFCCNQHTVLKAYPDHMKLVETDGEYATNTAKLIQTSQRYSVGTITSEDYLIVKYTNLRTLGTIEEAFIRQLNPSDTFLFAGHTLAVVRIQDDIVFVKKAKTKLPKFTRWFGGFMSYSSQLADAMLAQLTKFHNQTPLAEAYAQQFLNWQHRDSIVPTAEQCLVEYCVVDDCDTLFLYPFCGRAANHALAMGMTHQLSSQFKCLTAMSVNDYGIMIQADKPIDWSAFDIQRLLTVESIRDLSHASFNHNEMVLQEFRQICMVSGLIYKGMPGRLKSGRYTQSSVRILFDIFKEFDPNNLLLKQARDSVFNQQLFPQRLQDRLAVIANQFVFATPKKVSPFGFTLYSEQLSAKMDGDAS